MSSARDCQSDRVLMQTVDAINARMGCGAIGFAATEMRQEWKMQVGMRCGCDRDPCPTYEPDDPVDAVLELRGGRAEHLGLELGDSVEVEKLGR